MNFNVVKPFIDKNTNIGYNAGSTFKSDDEERVSFLTDKGYLEEKPKEKKAAKKSGE